MVRQKGQGRAATVETEPLERRELIQPRNGQRDPEREPRPGTVLVPTEVIQHIPASMEKDINDEARIGPNKNVDGDELLMAWCSISAQATPVSTIRETGKADSG